MKRFLLIWTATFFSLILPVSSSFAISPRHVTRVTEDHLFFLDFLTQIQTRDVMEKGELFDPVSGSQGTIKEKGNADSTRLLIRGGFRPTPQIELYGLIGGADLSIDEFEGFDASMSVAYGGGIRLVPYQSSYPGALYFFVDAQYLQFTAKDHVFTNFSGLGSIGQDEEIRWREYTAKVGLEANQDFFRPYGGLRFSFMRGKDIFSASGRLNLREDDNVGIFGGTDIFLDPAKRAALNLEFSLFDVDAIGVGLRLFF